MHNWENVRVEELICDFDFLFVLNPSLFQSSFGCHCFDTRAWPVMHHTPPHTFNLFICLRINSRVNSGMPYTTSKHRTSDPEHTGWGGALCSQTQSPSPGRDPWDLRGGGGVGFYFTTLLAAELMILFTWNVTVFSLCYTEEFLFYCLQYGNQIVQSEQVPILVIALHPEVAVIDLNMIWERVCLAKVNHPHTGLLWLIMHKQKRAANNLEKKENIYCIIIDVI